MISAGGRGDVAPAGSSVMPVNTVEIDEAPSGTRSASMKKALLRHLSVLEDPRSRRGIRHPLLNVL